MSPIKMDALGRAMDRYYRDHVLLSLWLEQIGGGLFNGGRLRGAVMGKVGDWTTLMCERRERDDGIDQARALDYARRVDRVRAYADELGVDVADACDHDHL